MSGARRGTIAENLVREDLGERGYDVVRSAASKGAADLWAVHENEVLFVQVKLAKRGERTVRLSPAERWELLRLARRVHGGLAIAATRTIGDRWNPAENVYRLITGPGPKDWEPWEPQPVRDRSAEL